MFTLLKLGAIRMRTWGVAGVMRHGFYRQNCWKNISCCGYRCRDCGNCKKQSNEEQERRNDN